MQAVMPSSTVALEQTAPVSTNTKVKPNPNAKGTANRGSMPTYPAPPVVTKPVAAPPKKK